jgi:hypothetical protein
MNEEIRNLAQVLRAAIQAQHSDYFWVKDPEFPDGAIDLNVDGILDPIALAEAVLEATKPTR